jgi:hypothetical protein
MAVHMPTKYICHKTEYILYTDSEMWPFFCARQEPKGALTSTIMDPARSSLGNRARSIVIEKVQNRDAAGHESLITNDKFWIEVPPAPNFM